MKNIPFGKKFKNFNKKIKTSEENLKKKKLLHNSFEFSLKTFFAKQALNETVKTSFHYNRIEVSSATFKILDFFYNDERYSIALLA